jgi:hypothetical protein
MDIKKYLLDQIKTYESLMKDLEEEPKQKESYKPKIEYQKNQIVIYWTKLMKILEIKRDLRIITNL